MDPNTDLPPMTTQHSDYFAAEPHYDEMIRAAITALNDKDGSSRQAISKYIEKEYTNLPSTHSVLLTNHLKRLKNEGQLIIYKHSYMLPSRSVPNYPTIDFSVTTSNDNALENYSNTLKRKPGRPPKLRQDPGFVVQESFDANVPPHQQQVHYNVGDGDDFETQTHLGGGANQDLQTQTHNEDLHVQYGSGSGIDFQGNSTGGAEPLFASLGLGDDGVVVPSPQPTENTSVVVVKRGRGRPPKASGGPKMMLVPMGGRIKKGRGRPKRIGIGPVTVPLSGNVMRPKSGLALRRPGRPRLRPAQNVVVNGEAGLVSRKRGRPFMNRSGSANNIQKMTEKTGSGTAVLVTDPRQLVVYQDLKNKYELLQLKVKQVASVVKGHIDPIYGSDALVALQELEAMASETQEAAAPY